MTLSWGHHPPELEPPRPPRHRLRRAILIALPIVVIGLVLVVPRLSVEDPVRVGIAALLDAQHKALAARDLDGYLATIDPSRVTLRTCEQQRFETAALLKLPAPALKLGRTEVYSGYVRAMVADLAGWRRIFLRND